MNRAIRRQHHPTAEQDAENRWEERERKGGGK